MLYQRCTISFEGVRSEFDGQEIFDVWTKKHALNLVCSMSGVLGDRYSIIENWFHYISGEFVGLINFGDEIPKDGNNQIEPMVGDLPNLIQRYIGDADLLDYRLSDKQTRQ